MTEEKKSRNPFINLANAAKKAAGESKVPAGKAAQVQAAMSSKRRQTGTVARPVKKASGRGR
jgi:hypothetical protein